MTTLGIASHKGHNLSCTHGRLYAILDKLPLYGVYLCDNPMYCKPAKRGVGLQHKIAWMYNIRGINRVRAIGVKAGLLFVRVD